MNRLGAVRRNTEVETNRSPGRLVVRLDRLTDPHGLEHACKQSPNRRRINQISLISPGEPHAESLSQELDETPLVRFRYAVAAAHRTSLYPSHEIADAAYPDRW